MENVFTHFESHLDDHLQSFTRVRELGSVFDSAVQLCLSSLSKGGKLVFFGNGGSAADAQHLAAEFVVRYKRERDPIGAVALTTDTSILTAHANDYEYDTVFARQVKALVKPEDVVIGISTSGNSNNVVLGIQAAKALGASTIALTGMKASQLSTLADVCLTAPSEVTARIQEVHIFLGHMLCEMIDRHAVGEGQ